jgi:filamentous hemagglutinin
MSATGNISAAGKISAAYLYGNGSNVYNIGAGSLTGTTLSSNVVSSSLTAVGTLASLSVSGTTNAADISATGNISAAGNIYGGNVIASNFATSGAPNTGNITGANLISSVTMSASGNVYGTMVGDLYGNVFATNVSATGNISAAGNITAGNAFFADAAANIVVVGNTTVTTGATFAVNATDSMLIPVGNTAQRPATAAVGMLRYNSTTSSCEVWNGAAWVAVGGSAYTVIANDSFTGDGTTTQFTLGSSQTTLSCIVTINGVVQAPTTAYAVSGTYPTCVLTFTEAPVVADIIEVREITTTTTVTAISNSTGNSVVSVKETTGEVDITGNLVAQLNAAAPSLSTNSTMSFQLVNNTTLAVKVRGTDGTTRTATLTLS